MWIKLDLSLEDEEDHYKEVKADAALAEAQVAAAFAEALAAAPAEAPPEAPADVPDA